MDMENYKPHRPTFVSVLVVIILILIVYHFTLGRKR